MERKKLTLRAYTSSAFLESAKICEKYHARCRRLFCSLTRVQVLPALSDRYRPPSEASTSAQTRSGLTGDTVTPMRPSTPIGSPSAWEMSVHVSPPSVVFQSPLPGPPLSRRHGLRLTCHNAA